VGVGVGAFMLAPQVLLIGQAVAAIGIILLCAGMMSAVLVEDEDKGSTFGEAGTLLLLLGLVISLLAYLLAAAGCCAVAGGAGLALKEGAGEVLRLRIRKRLESKSFTELLALSRQMDV
jgi:hypothetical protein